MNDPVFAFLNPSAIDTLPLTDRAYRRICELVQCRFGISLLGENKGLIVNRLRNHLVQNQYQSYEEYLDRLDKDINGQEMDFLATLISTNYTYFFREPSHFEFLYQEAFPELEDQLIHQGDLDLRVWCSAASTGEEPYSIVMTMLDYFGSRYHRYDAGLLATDLSLKVLRHASDGIYDAEQLEKVPVGQRTRYFCPIDDRRSAVSPDLRREIVFRKFNLNTEQFIFKKPFHIIFCRNVLIYFDSATRHRVVRQLYNSLLPGGYLFIGHTEGFDRDAIPFRQIRPAIFQRPGRGGVS